MKESEYNLKCNDCKLVAAAENFHDPENDGVLPQCPLCESKDISEAVARINLTAETFATGLDVGPGLRVHPRDLLYLLAQLPGSFQFTANKKEK